MSIQEAVSRDTVIHTARELGALLRTLRVSQHITLEKASGITRLGMRFLSELERGKETAQLGKVIHIITQLGLEIVIRPRRYQRRDKIND